MDIQPIPLVPSREGGPYRVLLGLVALVGGLLGLAGLYFVPIPEVICPLLSGPVTIIVWTMKEIWDGIEEAQCGGDYREAA